jgi:hypothetical protein
MKKNGKGCEWMERGCSKNWVTVILKEYLHKAACLYALGEYDEAIKTNEMGLEHDPINE